MTYKDIVADHGARMSLRQAGGDEYWGTCPWCGRTELHLDPRTNQFQCHYGPCRAHGRMDELDAKMRRA